MAVEARCTRRIGAYLPPASPGAEALELDTHHQFVARTDDPPPPDLLDAPEQRELAAIPLVGQDGDGPSLSHCLELDHAGKYGIIREVAGEEGLVARDPIAGGDRGSGLEGIDSVDEAERWPMRKQGYELV